MKMIITILAVGLFSAPVVFAAKGNAAKGKAKIATCTACHGADGKGIQPIYPNLCGQHEEYIVTQLKNFKKGDRKNALMNPMAASLSEQDMRDIAAYYHSQKCN